MRTIWKQVVEPNSSRDNPYPISFRAPAGSKAISVGVQQGLVCVWYEVDPDEPMGMLTIYSVGTGFGAVPPKAEFFGTVQHNGFVWHFYR